MGGGIEIHHTTTAKNNPRKTAGEGLVGHTFLSFIFDDARR
jgi:hypothetical protein